MRFRSVLGAAPRPARALLGLALVLGVTAGVTSPSAADEAGDKQQEVKKYVAMGDSWAGGMMDLLDYTSGPCAQGRVSYPKIVAERLKAQLVNMTCNGGTVAAMSLQIGAVPADTDLITITTGANDLPWADLVVGCGFPGLIPVGVVAPEVGACSIGNEVLGGGLAKRAQAFHENLGAFLDKLQVQAPQARIFLVGYPKMFPPPEEHCWPIVPVTGADLNFYEELLTTPNKVMIEFAKDTNYPRVGYVDTHWGSKGHDICKGAETWVNSWFAFAFGQAPLHPNEKGIRAMADEVLRALGLTKN